MGVCFRTRILSKRLARVAKLYSGSQQREAIFRTRIFGTRIFRTPIPKARGASTRLVRAAPCHVVAGTAVLLLFTAQAAWAQTGSITGRVTSAETGQGVADAQIEAVAADGEVAARALSTADGAYRLTDLLDGAYTLVVAIAGFQTERIEDVQVVAGQTTIIGAQLAAAAFVLNPVVVSASRAPEAALEAPATVAVVDEAAIDTRPAISPIGHLRATPGVDLIKYGLQSANVVTRGFNNFFSGALYTLTDYRIASVPSLRVNLLHFVPATDADIERIEVVLGPGSALYGPNTANGVLHIITKSPLDDQGTSIAVAGGERDVLQANFRTAQLLGDNLGIKFSGHYFQGHDWEFLDVVEQEARQQATQNPTACLQQWLAGGISQGEAELRCDRVGLRDFDLERWSVDARADWRVTPEFTTVFSAGVTRAVNAIEITGIGAAQARDWTYSYYQVRANAGRFFGQVYLNASNAGDTFLLKNGATIIDRSKLFVAQLQHGFSLGERQDFTYGVDLLRTIPVTEGTINGANEEDDELTEIGGYIQSETALSPMFDLVLAGRLDHHSALDDPVFSPRAGLVFKPVENHNFRITYNSAFETPSSLNLFLDIHGGPVPNEQLAPLGYTLRAQGPGTEGIPLLDVDGNLLGMRSPFNPAGAGQLTPASGATLWQYAVGLLRARGFIDDATAAEMAALDASGVGYDLLDPATQELTDQPVPLNVPPIEESRQSTFELGYKGLIGDGILLAADAWYTEKSNFISPLIAVTPFLLLDGESTAAMLVPYYLSKGMSQEQATAAAAALLGGTPATAGIGIAEVPLAVASSDAVHAVGADVLATYRNFGEVDLWGADLSAKILLGDEWSIGLSGSYVSDDHFRVPLQGTEEIVALNAPSLKGSASLGYQNAEVGFTGEARLRAHNEFPANSAGYMGLQCLGIGTNDCVDSATVVDLTLGYELPFDRRASLQLAVTNLFDSEYRSFVQVPEIGRLALLRLRYEM